MFAAACLFASVSMLFTGDRVSAGMSAIIGIGFVLLARPEPPGAP